MRNTIVEMVARSGRLEVLLNNIHGEKEMHWVNGHPVSRLYRYAMRTCCTSAAGAQKESHLSGTSALLLLQSWAARLPCSALSCCTKLRPATP